VAATKILAIKAGTSIVGLPTLTHLLCQPAYLVLCLLQVLVLVKVVFCFEQLN